RVESSVGGEDAAVGSDHICDSLDEAVDGDGSVGGRDPPRGIRDEVEPQAVLLPELPMGRFVLRAHAEDDRADLAEGLEVIAEGASLPRASERVVIRIEVQHDALPPQIPQPHGNAVLVRPLEVRRVGAGRQEVGHRTPDESSEGYEGFWSSLREHRTESSRITTPGEPNLRGSAERRCSPGPR